MESDVRVFLIEHGFLFGKGNCFYYTTQDGLVSHPSASDEQGTWLKCQRSNHNTGSADCSVLHCPQTGASASLYLALRRNHWVFSVNSGKFEPFSASVPVFSTPNISGHAVVGLKSKY